MDNNIDQQNHLAHSRLSQYQENHKPMFKDCQRYNPKVEEEQPSQTFVIRVQAVDEDPPDREGGRITYTIEEPPGTRPNFKINKRTGEITTALPFDRDEPNRQKEIYLTVRAVDDGRPELADICTIKVTVEDINDNSPSFDQHDYSSNVSEDLPENSEVLRVFAYDLDDRENARLTYSFVNGNDQFEDYFRIDSVTGVIYLKKQLLGKQSKRFSSTVEVSDNGKEKNTARADVVFTVVDSNKRPPTIEVVGGNRVIHLKEDENDFEKPLVALSAQSNIDDPSVVFELVKGKTTQTNKDQTFILSPSGPTSAQITMARPLDYETVEEYQLTVRAKNKDLLYASVTINVKVEDVNDEIPTFIELLRGSIVENDKIGAQAMTVRAIDKDGTSPNNLVVYELLDYKDLFEIDKNSGVITAKASFDREKEKLYHVTVQARDSAISALFPSKNKPNVANQTFQISIEDQNDNQPKFTKSLYQVYNISENADTQKDVAEVKAIDADTASRIEYSIIEGNINDAFLIEPTTGRIKVNNKLDYEKVEEYNLTVQANDGIYTDTAKVFIQISNENDEIPVFEPYNKDIQFEEERTSEDCIITLIAYDPDIKDRSADQKIVYRVGEAYKSFLSVGRNGCVTVTKPLDRDLPNGSSSYQAYIYADDYEGGPNSLSNYAEINIILRDINDNAPYLEQTEVVWQENQEPDGQTPIITLTANDNDGPENGPPFTFEIPSYEMTEKFEIRDKQLFAKIRFDREERKYYDVPIKITDNGSPSQSGTSILKVIIGDVNDNAAQDGSSEIFVYKYEGIKMDTEIGRVYVTDPDDWDLPDKVFEPDGYLDSNFEIGRIGGMITMKKEIVPNVYKLNFVVKEELMNGTLNTVHADVTVTVKEIPEEAVRKSGSIRLKGITSEDFITKNPTTLTSRKDLLQKHLAEVFNTSIENVDVFTVMPSHNSTFVDVRFSAHGSPYYAPERLNNKVTVEQEALERELGAEIIMISINECLQPDVCLNGSCSNILQIRDDPAVVFTNKTSFVGVKAVAEAVCECRKHMTKECFNGGTPIEGICNCPEGFTGPNCESLGISFAGDGWAMYPPFDSCNNTLISFSVLPQTDDGLIFYVGPLSKRQAELNKDFMSVEMRGGFVVLKVDFGDDTEEFISDYKKINDGGSHKIKINYTNVEVQIEVDECPSDCIKWASFRKGGLLKTNGPLQIGGRSNIFTQEEAKMIWSNPPSSVGFRGCITNFTYNSYVYNLGAPSDKYHAHEGTCDYGMFQAAKFGIDSNFLVAILVCLAILLILLLAVVVHKRKHDNFNEKDLDDTRENIINYEDEGGGECDTNFDLSVLRNNIDEKPPMTDHLYKHEVPADIGSFLDDKKRACDKDTLPCDDVRHYGYEGDGNSSGSLSSLASCTDEGDLKFNYLSSFGPRFRKLADMYGDDASEEGSQNGAEESWC
ncbi:DE cadherin-like protein [Tribolium castaneum]|uniref:DE cadherin-like protein n=2 Tax=Tribolium castaneum TaxID=7070 RepID=D6W781_TRICA|nr:DE cadherin-like protein [Tribolium castaneum]